MWHTTLKDKFSWVLGNNDFIISFLEGFFDSEGTAYYETRKRAKYMIKFSSSDLNTIKIIRDMLVKLGIDSKTYWCINKRKNISYYRDVYITNQINTVKLAKLIHSSIPRKEENLKKLRELNPYLRICLSCKKDFVPTNPNQFCCSQKCMKSNYRNKNRERLNDYINEWAKNKRRKLKLKK